MTASVVVLVEMCRVADHTPLEQNGGATRRHRTLLHQPYEFSSCCVPQQQPSKSSHTPPLPFSRRSCCAAVITLRALAKAAPGRIPPRDRVTHAAAGGVAAAPSPACTSGGVCIRQNTKAITQAKTMP